MGTRVGTIDLDLALQSDSFRKQLQQTVTRAVRNTNQQLGRVGSAGSALSGAFGKLGKIIAGAFAVSKITAFGKECLSLGSDLAEVQNVVDVTFGGLSDSVDKFAKNAAKQFGLSETMAKKYAGTYGSMAEAFGFTQKQALDMSEALTGLTGDVASFYNISQDEAYTKIKSVFSGETETLKDLGVVMTQSALDAYALSNGFGKTTAEMSEAEKVSLRYAFVQEKLANAQGDYARTSDGWANSTRTLALQFDTLKAELGQGLINVFSPIVQWLNIIVERLTAAATKFKEFTAAIMGVSSDTSSGVGSTAASTEALNDSLSTTESNAKSAAKAMRDLMGFDEINRLSDKSDSTSSTPSAGQTPASTADNSNDKDKKNTLADSLQHIKKLWDDLYGSFKKGLTTRLNAGNTFQALDNIKQKLGRIKDTLKGIFTDSAVVSSAKRMLQQIAAYYGSMVGNFLSIGANLGNALVTGIATFLGRKEEFLKKKLASIFQSTGDIFGSLTSIMNDVTDIINYILQLPETAQVVADVIDIIVTPWVTGLDLLLKFVRDNFSGIAEVINTNKENFMQIGEDLMRFFSTITGAVSDFVDHVSQKAEEVYDQYIAPAIQRIWDGINSLVTFLTGIWQQYISPFLDTIAQGVAELIHDHLKPMADTLLEVFGKAVELISVLWKQYAEPFIEWWIANVAPIIMPVLREVWALVKLVVKDVIDKIENVLKILGGLLDFLIGVFTGDWSRAWGGIQEIFDGFVETHKDSSKNLADFLKEKQVTIRINRWNNTIEETKKSLESQGAELEKAPYLGEAFYLKNFETIASLNAFQEGRFQIQDVSSMMAAHLADPKPGDQVLDLCAAPGGKSLHAADKMRNQGCVEARDLTEYKVDLIRENVQRAGVSCVVPKVKDAEQLDAEWIGKADVVIADLPCTGYGVIGRKPDIKYYASKEKEEELVRIQRAILANAASYVKPGGTLLYSTCTVNRKENSENAAWFLEQFPFEAVSLDELLPDELKSGETAKGQLQLIPGVHKTDGFFLAKFRKTEEGRA